MARTTIDREAWSAAAIGGVPAGLALLAGRRRTALALAALPAGIVAFFRDPERPIDSSVPDPDVVVAPADGKVMYAGPAQPEVSPAGDWQQVSIFLSVFDVHINRTPFGGTVTDVQYRPGRWHAAYRFESAFENERSDLTVVNGDRTVIFRQIVGLVARRVVTRVKPCDVLRTGDRIGLMKFGSRMDVFVPPEVRLGIEAGARTVGGVTELGRW
jgi:phosphatidylserine decarboxylase